MGCQPQPSREYYWNTNRGSENTAQFGAGVFDLVRGAMGLKRWEQIHRFFYAFDIETMVDDYHSGKARVRPFHKVAQLADILKFRFKFYWNASRNLAVDEQIIRFTGRASEIVHIPGKPTPVGFKIWAIADGGYVMDFMWHAKGDEKKGNGPQGITPMWREQISSVTQQLVLELVQRIPNHGQGHVIWLDNLFTSELLLSILRDIGVGGAGTVRTTKTAREERAEKEALKESLPGSIFTDADDQDIDQYATPGLKRKASSPPDASQPPSKTQKTKVGPKKTGPKEAPTELDRGVDPFLADIKRRHKSQLKWGTLYSTTSKDKKVCQFLWMDASPVLFMSTINDGTDTVERLRKRPSNAPKIVKAEWGDLYTKKLPVPGFIDGYNHGMNGVDISDHIRDGCNTLRRCYRTWCPLWHYLLDTSLCNAALIWAKHQHYPKEGYDSLHRVFRMQIARKWMALNTTQKRIQNPRSQPLNPYLAVLKQDTQVPSHSYGLLERHGYCKSCSRAGRKAIARIERIALSELSVNSVRGVAGAKKSRQRPPSVKYGCLGCQVNLCNLPQCLLEHEK